MSYQPPTPKKSNTGLWLGGAAIVLVALIAVLVLLLNRQPAPAAPASAVIVSAASPTAEPAATPATADTTAPAATETSTPTSTPMPELGTSNLFIEYILDASGSMSETLSDGSPKIGVAQRVLTEHMRSFRPETNIGLRVYGHRLPYQQTDESCQDIELIASPEKGQMERIVGWLQDFTVQGMTPLAASLELAKDDFVYDASRINSIVMLSDGIETCGGDPCQLVEDLKAEGINFTIHVIGLDVDDPTRQQLTCIAQAGRGTYHDARSQQELSAALGAVRADVTRGEVVVPPGVDTPAPPPPTSTPTPASSGEISWTEPERLGPAGGYTQQLLLDPAGRLWAFWEEHVLQPDRIYAAVHYRIWNGQNWGELEDVPGSDQMGEPVATILNDGSILLRADLPINVATNQFETRWFRYQDGQWTPVPEMTAMAPSMVGAGGNMAADGFGAIHVLTTEAQAWKGTTWQPTGTGPNTMFKATAQDSKGNLHAVTSSQDGIQHWMWDGDHWAMKETIFMPNDADTASWPALAIGPDDTLHVVWDNSKKWQAGPNTPVPYWISYSRWNGTQWTAPQTLFGPLDDKSNWNPDIAVLPDGLVLVVWGDVGLLPDSSIYATWGDGAAWVEPVLLHHDTKDDQKDARVEADAEGRIHVIWSTAGGRGVFHVFGTRQ